MLKILYVLIGPNIPYFLYFNEIERTSNASYTHNTYVFIYIFYKQNT